MERSNDPAPAHGKARELAAQRHISLLLRFGWPVALDGGGRWTIEERMDVFDTALMAWRIALKDRGIQWR